MWSWLGHGDPKAIAGMTAAALLVVVVVGRLLQGSFAKRSRESYFPDKRESRPQRAIIVSVLGWVALGLLVACSVASGLLWLFGWPGLPSATQFKTGQILDLLKIALAVVAGLGGVVLLAVNLRKQRVTEAEHGLARQRDAREQEQLYNERFGTTAEQLAHENAAVRLAGVYAMAALGDDWERQRQVCADVLCGYLRLSAQEAEPAEEKVRETLQRELLKRLSYSGTWTSSGLRLDFTGASFRNVDFYRTGIAGADFGETQFSGDYTYLGGLQPYWGVGSSIFSAALTFFSGDERLVDAVFEGTTVVLDGEQLLYDRVDFVNCEFRDTKFDVYGPQWMHGPVIFENCDFTRCTFKFTELASALPLAHHSRARFALEDSVVNESHFDLREAEQAEHWLWLVDTKLNSVTFTEELDPERQDTKTLNVRRVTLEDTVLPERHVRYRDSQDQNSTANSVRGAN